MVRSSVYRKLGGLDARFFAHMEEIDLCWRMQLEGWKVTVVPQSLVYHVGGGTLPASSPFKLFLNYRNNLLMLENNLAKTFALEEVRKGHGIQKAAVKACRRAGRQITVRRCLDILSSMVYLLTFNLSSFKAVRKAHKECASMSKGIQQQDIESYLKDFKEKGQVTGIYSKWIIMQSLLKGNHIFNSITDEDFYRI